MIERVVDIAGHDVRIVGDDADEYVEHLPERIHETALECASVLLADDAVILDVGANVGVTAIGFAQVARRGRVLAIEPSPRAFPYLVRNIEAAGVAHVDTLQVAASDVAGTLEFFDNDWFSAGSFVKGQTLASNLDIHVAGIKVPAEPIDSIVERLGLTAVDFIKLDVEGHELQALHGARSTLLRFEPTAVIESNLFTTTCLGNTLPFDFLVDIRSAFPYVYDYDRFDGLLPMVDEQGMYDVVQRQFLSGRPSDLICCFVPLSDELQHELMRRTTESPLRAAHRELAALRERLESADAALEVARAEHSGLEERLDATQAALDGVRLEEDALRERVVSVEVALDAALEDNRALRASTSWKLTAPVRLVSTRFRRPAR